MIASAFIPRTSSERKGLSFVESDDTERSDPTVNSDALPDDHPIHLLAEAQVFYKGSRPPFVLNKRSEQTKDVVIPTKNGSRPKDDKAVKVRIVAKVCTIDFSFAQCVTGV